MKQTRPYQEEAIANTLAAWSDGHKSILGVAATGAGKTYMAARILKAALKTGQRAVFNAPRIEIVNATAETMRAVGLSVGIVQADRKEFSAQVIVGTKDSILANVSKILEYGPIDIEVTDEAHHVTAPSWMKIRERLYRDNPDMLSLGITATPQAANGIELARVYSKVAFYIPIKMLVEQGYLVEPICYSYNLPEGATQDEVFQMVIRAWETRTNQGTPHARTRTMVFVRTRAAAAELSAAFRAKGHLFADISGNTPAQIRRECMEMFEAGRLQGVVNDNVWTEGVDIVPADALINLKPTQSTTVFTQMVGRVLRADYVRYPNKRDAVVLNFAPRDSQKLGVVNPSDMLGMGRDMPALNERIQDLFYRPIRLNAPKVRGRELWEMMVNGRNW